MLKIVLVACAGLLLLCGEAMATCSSYPYNLTNGTTADATQVMANFNCAALTDGNFSGTVSAPAISVSGNAYVSTFSTGGAPATTNRNVIWMPGATEDAGNPIFTVGKNGTAAGTFYVIAVSAAGFNNSNTAFFMGKDAVTGRSINAGGTINASGADYAEWERVATGFSGTDFAKGSVVGFDDKGQVTADCQRSMSFSVISTEPSFVGGDAWGANAPEKLTDREKKAWIAEQQRTVVQIAYSGKVPVNFREARPGQYLSAYCNGKMIDIRAQDHRDENTVGRVRTILADGRAQIAVAQ